jgi:hypothetical protein
MTQFKSEHLPLTKKHFADWAKWEKEHNHEQWNRESCYESVLRYQSEFPNPITLDQAIQIIKDAGGKVLMPTTEYKEV